MEYNGYSGNVLYVDLSSGDIRKEPLDIDIAKKFIGGPGVGFSLLMDTLKPNTDPLSPENVLVFGTGPLNGTLVPGKCYLATKYTMPSNKEGNKFFVSSSMFGGNRFGSMMKNAGYDHVVITGRAEKPSYLKVTDEEIKICDANDIWGKDVYESAGILRKRHPGITGPCGTWLVGSAGENLVRFSLGWSDDWHNAGRYAGAVAGSKNLKGIITLGRTGITLADKKGFLEVVQRKRQKIKSQPDFSPVVPFGRGKIGKILTETMVGINGCGGGLCASKTVHEVKEGKHKGEWFGGTFAGMPFFIQMTLELKEYGEAFALLGRMNKDGFCLTTAMNMLAFVTKYHEQGVLSKEDMGGLDPMKGDLNYYISILDMVLHKRNIGATMSDGWYALCERVNLDPSTDYETDCAITKGTDLLVDARIWPSLYKTGSGFSPCLGLGSVVHAKGKHTHSATYWSHDELSLSEIKKDAEKMGLTREEIQRVFSKESFDTGKLEKYGSEAEALYNAMGICDTSVHWQYDPNRDMQWLSKVYAAATGFDISPRELLRAGERSINLEKLLNVREGFEREDDRIPPVYLQNIDTPLKAREGDRYLTDWFGKRLNEEDLEAILDAHYEERGWDVKRGVPTKEKLTELGMGEYSEIL